MDEENSQENNEKIEENMPQEEGQNIEVNEKTNTENEPQNALENPKDPENNEEEKLEVGVFPRLIEEEMKQSYLDYAMSVIVGRALPDVRDGLKPVHRRILFAMNDMGMFHDKPFKKCARIVGECLGKYHPHGDTAVYDSLVRMAQPFSLRYMLIQGHGNFGSIDGDSAASMRYTEARLQKISKELLIDIDKETVNFVDNFDGSLKEPSVLPSKFPNLLVNGSSGIAVGMATNVPPHNLKEVCQGAIQVVDNPEITVAELCNTIKGPDFPTSGLIMGKMGIAHAYARGKSRIKVRGRTEIEEHKGHQRIIVNEIPYMVNKSLLIQQIAEYVKDKSIEGISDLRDESDRNGMRIVIELKKDANSDIVLNQLYKYTRLQNTFSINMLALVNNEPKVLDLKEMLVCFIQHRKEVIRRRTEYELKKAEDRLHILDGIIIALNDIDNVIKLIKESRSTEFARNNLMTRYSLSEIQAKAILDMKLQRLTSLEQDKIKNEQAELQERIKDLKDILEREVRVNDIIKEDMNYIIETFGDDRRTEIVDCAEEDQDIDIEDLIEPEDMVVTITHKGYIKRLPMDTYKKQNRGGVGIIATGTKEEDFVEDIFVANTHNTMLFFTDKGIVHWLKVYNIPEGSRQAQGKAIVNLLELKDGARVTACIPIQKFKVDQYILMATKNGVVKKTSLAAYSRPRAGGIIALTLDEGDALVNVVLTEGEDHIMLATRNGMAVKFSEKDARPIGRTSRGVRGVKLRSDEVIGMMKVDESKAVLTITENGYGKRTAAKDYRLINRGGVGVKNIICSERNGKVVAVKSVTDDDEAMFISQNGIIIRTSCKGISIIGRNTQGMRLMKLRAGDKVVAAARIAGEEDEFEKEIDKELDLEESPVTEKKEEEEIIEKEIAEIPSEKQVEEEELKKEQEETEELP